MLHTILLPIYIFNIGSVHNGIFTKIHRYACSVDGVFTTYNSNTVTLLSNLSYRPFGIAKGMDAGNSGTVNNVFDQSGRLTVANPGADKERTYTYDANGNLTSVSAPNVAWYNRIFGYDALNRLEHAEGPFGTIDYTYDGVGNRLTKVENTQAESYTYFPGTNRLQEVTGPVAYTYDANGNITGIGSKVLVYNQNNRLIRVEENSNILGEYAYNGLGQRVIKSASGNTTVFHYDFNGNIIGESDLNGNFTKEYLYRGKGRLAMVDAASGEIFYFLNDRLGTPQIMTDATNTVIWEGVYKPFGEADVNPNSSVVNNFRFAGQYFDEETGLHYNYHRYYDPKTGRYLRADPLSFLGGDINLYVYAANNAVNLTDPLGLELKFNELKEAAKVAETHPEVFIEALKQIAHSEKYNLIRTGREPFTYEVIADSWCDIPESVRTYNTGTPWKDVASTFGSHYEEKRFLGGYHIHTDKPKGPVKMHFDAIDPMKSKENIWPHIEIEYLRLDPLPDFIGP